MTNSNSKKADTYEPDHRNAFWGAKNYARLATIKKQVDPNNVLAVWHGVGFEESSPLWKCYKA
jgi:FAD/FMN-containing dehydrogenase